MTNRAYKNIAEAFYVRTGLHHTRIQFKNRWDQLKGLYAFWMYCNKHTGLGKASNGAILADEEFWEESTKVLCLFCIC